MNSIIENRGFTAIGVWGARWTARAHTQRLGDVSVHFGTVQHSDCHLTLGITEIRCETSEKRSGHGAALFRDAHRLQSRSLAVAVGSGRCKACFGLSQRVR